MANRVASVLKIRPEEARLVLLVGALFMCIQAGGGMGDNAASALFFSRFGVDFLPYMYMILGALNFVAALAYSAGLGRFRRDRYPLWLIGGFAVLLLIERAAILRPFPLLYPALWLTMSGISLILGTFVWNVASQVCDARQAKRLFPLFTSAGILGSVLGNSITGIVAKVFGTDNLIILYAGLLGMALYLTHQITQSYLKPFSKLTKQPSLLKDLRVGFDFVRTSSLMRLISFASILLSILYFGIAFPFNRVAATTFPDEAQLAGFLGLFSSITTGATFLVSLFVANRLYVRLGIVNSVLILPIAYALGSAIFALDYNLTGAMIARFGQLVVLSGVGDSAWNALFNVVPSQKHGQVHAFQNGVPAQIGVVLSGVLLILGEKILMPQQIFLMGILIALVCAGLVWRMRSAYGEALIAALRAGRLEVFIAQETTFLGLRSDRFAIKIAVQSLRDPKSTTRRLAAEMLGKMGANSAIPELVIALKESDTSVRPTIIRTLGQLDAQEAIDAIMPHLDDQQADIRVAALESFSRLRLDFTPALSGKLETLLNDPLTQVRMRVVVLLAKLGFVERALTILMDQLNQTEIDQRLMGLEVLGELAELANTKRWRSSAIQPIILALRDPAPSIRRAACNALAYLNDGSTIEPLVNCLFDPDASVRWAASKSLENFGNQARAYLLPILNSNNGDAQEAVLEILSPDQEETREALLTFGRQETSNVQILRHLLEGLEGQTSSIKLLHAILLGRMTLCAKRLIKTVGLFGNPQAMELVSKSLHAPNAQTRAAALETLETLGDKQLTRQIIPLLEGVSQQKQGGNPASDPSDTLDVLLMDPDQWVRALAVRASADLGLRNFIPRLHDLQNDRSSLVRISVGEALHQFGEVNPMDTLQTVSTLERILLLREVPIFAGLSPEDLKQVADIAREQWFPEGSLICRAGEEGNAMYIIVSGQVQVLKESADGEKVIANRGVGDFVGEMAIIESAPRTATLRAGGELRVMVIDGEAFNAILRDRPEVAFSVMRTLSRRLREMIN